MESLRFLMVTTHYPPNHIGGDAIFVKYLADELGKRGHEVHVITCPSVSRVLRKNWHSRSGDEPSTVHPYEPRNPRLNLLMSYSLGFAQRAEKHFSDAVSNLRPDIIHWHNTKGFIPTPLPTPSGTALLTAHDYYAVCPRTNLIRPGGIPCIEPNLCQLCLARWHRLPQIWRTMRRRVVHIPPDIEVLSPSQFMADRLTADGIRANIVLRNFVPDPGTGSVGESTENLLAYVGILEPHKGVDTLIRAFHQSRDLQGFRLAIVGGGSLETRLSDTIRGLRIGDRITMMGRIPSDALRNIFCRSSAVVMPSIWYENSPLVAIEAFSHGTPLIGSAIGGIPELLTEDSGSMIFEAGSVNGLSERIVELWRDRDNLEERKRKARKVYEDTFTPEAHISRYFDIIRGRRPS